MNVVVTGASTGIGRATVLHLAARGHRVFAGVRKEADGEDLRTAGLGGRVVPLLLEVTDAAAIHAAAEAVAREIAGEPLHGLVNNAGVGFGGPVEHIPLETWRKQLEVNLIGAIAVMQAFLPLVRRGPGRIVNISSIGGKVATPFLGPYCASKFALEAVSDSLRIELRSQGIGVVLVEPGAIATPIWGKAQGLLASARQEFGEEAFTRYQDGYAAMERLLQMQEKSGVPPERVAVAIERALTARRAPVRMLVGTDARMGAFFKWLLPHRWFDALASWM